MFQISQVEIEKTDKQYNMPIICDQEREVSGDINKTWVDTYPELLREWDKFICNLAGMTLGQVQESGKYRIYRDNVMLTTLIDKFDITDGIFNVTIARKPLVKGDLYGEKEKVFKMINSLRVDIGEYYAKKVQPGEVAQARGFKICEGFTVSPETLEELISGDKKTLVEKGYIKVN